MEWVAGKNAVLELLRADFRPVATLYVSRKMEDPSLQQIVALAKQKNIKIQTVSSQDLYNKSGVETHQGVAAQTEKFHYAELSDVVATCVDQPHGSFLVLLDEIQDPHNVGALIRTAHLTGAKGLVLLEHRAVGVTATVAKGAAGAVEHLPIVQEVNLVNCINVLKKKGFMVVGAAGESGATDLYRFECQWPLALVLGGEEKGLRRMVRESCDLLLSIPMEGKIDSYNVSVAGGMFMGEFLRQKQCKK